MSKITTNDDILFHKSVEKVQEYENYNNFKIEGKILFFGFRKFDFIFHFFSWIISLEDLKNSNMDAKIDLIHYNNNIKNKLIPRKFFTNYKILLTYKK